jgi:SAM-dependent methyltransferase
MALPGRGARVELAAMIDVSDSIRQSYEELPYHSLPLYQCHPGRMATTAYLAGLRPVDVERCRVLELGCASGGHLIPLAESLPASRFVGIDLAPTQIADGQAVIQALGLSNIKLRAMSLTDIDDGFGQFDYIIAHGVYSWVPAAVQEKLLSICARNLSPNGVAYVSYNIYPGWHQKRMVREMLLYHGRGAADLRTRVARAHELAELLIETADRSEAYGFSLVEQAEKLRNRPESYVAHELLEPENRPLYFHEFVARAQQSGLQYVGDAEVQPFVEDLHPDLQSMLRELDDEVAFEQYLDFIRCGTFRRSVLCRAEVSLDRRPTLARIFNLSLTSQAKPESQHPDVTGTTPETFLAALGSITSQLPAVKALLVTLYERWPHATPVPELGALMRQRLGPSAPLSDEELARVVMRCYSNNLTAASTYSPFFVTTPGERPLATPLARYQAVRGGEVTSRRHLSITIGDLERAVLRRLDGTRDRATLTAELADEGVDLAAAGGPLDQAIAATLHRLAQNALLIA